ncbi:NmrA family NAD(P)-binding protein [Tellurirhabdus rosea]|uniref:NmrA family NAD(P)-binding protein n=1 Tax=Tellurirhabdus rosea TaxID=2674997 RepID=UPI00225ACDB3|nr:NmrA family NAD(P)-binding protein [Tellurirhabdus rosea]
MYVITGASGNTGKQVAIHLLEAGKPVTVIGRDAGRLQELVDKGAVAAIGSLEDEAFLRRTFDGATAVYALIPPHFATDDFPGYQRRTADALVAALETGGVTHVVTLSSMGAHLTETGGVVKGLGHMEKAFESRTGLHVLHLRAGFFFQNFLGNIGLVKQAGILGGFPIDGNKPMAMVHTDDIAEVATRRLLALDFTGQSHEFVAGPRDLTFDEVAATLGKAIGRDDLPWVTFSYEQAREGMLQMGMKPTLADAYVEFCQRVNDGSLAEGFVRTPENSTPTTLEQFAQREFAPAYQAG